MSIEKPESLADWEAHIGALAGAELRSKAIAANQIGFVRALLKEGWAPDEVESIFILLGRRLVADGQRPPSAGLYDLGELAQRILPP